MTNLYSFKTYLMVRKLISHEIKFGIQQFDLIIIIGLNWVSSLFSYISLHYFILYLKLFSVTVHSLNEC
jgi:hypothetical protein